MCRFVLETMYCLQLKCNTFPISDVLLVVILVLLLFVCFCWCGLFLFLLCLLLLLFYCCCVVFVGVGEERGVKVQYLPFIYVHSSHSLKHGQARLCFSRRNALQ